MVGEAVAGPRQVIALTGHSGSQFRWMIPPRPAPAGQLKGVYERKASSLRGIHPEHLVLNSGTKSGDSHQLYVASAMEISFC